MDTTIIEKYLNVLDLKSKDNLRKGYSQTEIAKLIGLDRNQALNVLHYLSTKGLIDTKSGYGDKVLLTHQGIDYILASRKDKTFKTIKFKSANYIPPTTRMVFGFLYWYDIINEDKTVESKTIAVYASDVLSMMWKLPFGDRPKDAEKILLQFAKDTVIEKLKEGTLNEHEEIVLMSSAQPPNCPYDAKNLVATEIAEYEIETGQKLLIEEIKENRLAASIIETRDTINAIFKFKHSENLLLLNQERNLLDFFKPATSEEEFKHRLSSLGEVSRNLNVECLRKLTNETNKEVKSVMLLENFLSLMGKSNTGIVSTLRQIGRLRQGYPTHIDIADVIKAHKHFGFKYPIDAFETAWTTLLDFYLKALKELYEILADAYLK